MKRRSFISGFVGAIAAAAVSARLIREEPRPDVVRRATTLEEILNRQAHVIVDDVYRVALTQSTWNDLLQKAPFP